MMQRLPLLLPALFAAIVVGCGQSAETPGPGPEAVVSAPSNPAVAAAPGCPYLPEFLSLRSELPGLDAAVVADRLNRYAAQYSNPEGCEGTELERLLNDAESQLFHLAFADTRYPAQLTLRCESWDARTTRCQGPVEDGTAHPTTLGLTALTLPTSSFRLETGLKDAKLLGAYVVSLAAALDGKPAQPLSGGSAFDLPSGTKDVAVVAIYETGGNWPFRKVIWYF